SFGIVGVEQEYEIVGSRLRECRECRRFVIESLDEGMRHGAVERDAEIPAGQYRGGPGETGDVARPCRHESRLGAMRAPHAEVDQDLAGRREHHARRLGGDQYLEMKDVDK